MTANEINNIDRVILIAISIIPAVNDNWVVSTSSLYNEDLLKQTKDCTMVWALSIREPVGNLELGHWRTFARLKRNTCSSHNLTSSQIATQLQCIIIIACPSYVHILDTKVSCHNVVRYFLWEHLHPKVPIDLTWISFRRPVFVECILTTAQQERH